MEVPLSIAAVLVITMLFLFYAGFGITRLLAFHRVRGEELLIAPSVGFSLIVTIAYWCGWLGWSAGHILAAVFAVATLCNFLAVLRRRGNPLRVRKHLPVYAVAFGAYAIAVAPILTVGTLTPLGTNGDQVWYTNVATSLAENNFPPPSPARRPAMVQLSLSYDVALPLGFSYLHVLIDQLSRREAHETFSLVTASSLPLNVLVYTFVAACLFGIGPLGRLLIAFLTAASPALMWVHYNNYAPHAMSLSLVPLAFCLPILTFTEGRQHIPLAALLLSAAFVTYPPASPILTLCPIIVYIALQSVQQRNTLAPSLQTLVQLLALAAVLNVPGLLYGGKVFRDVANVEWTKEFGDVAHYVSWTELYGFSHHRISEHVNPLAFVPSWPLILGFCVGALTLYGAWRGKMPGKLAFTSLVITELPFLLWLRCGLDYPYAFFKALTFFSFPAVTGLALGFERLLLARNNTVGALKIVVALAFLGLILGTSGVNLFALAQRVTTVTLDFPSLLALRNVKGLIQETERLHIRDARDTPLLWMTYFLRDYDLSLAHYTPYYFWRDWPFYQQVIDTDLVLVDEESPLSTIWAIETVYANHRFRLLRKDPSILHHIDFEDEARPLRPGDTITLRASANQVVIENRSFHLVRGAYEGQMLRLGIWAPTGAVIQLNASGSAQTTELVEDLTVLDWPLRSIPWEMTLTNEGPRTLWIPGWLEVLQKTDRFDSRPAPADILAWHREEVVPSSGFFGIRGWYPLEGGKQRWMRQESMAVFRNPKRAVVLALEGVLPENAEAAPPQATILLSGRVLGVLNKVGPFRQAFLVPEEVLGPSQWGELEIWVSRTFNPKQLGLSKDSRDLGVLVSDLALLDLGLAPDGLIDLGTLEARKHLGDGWSTDERTDAVTYVWADGLESRLWVTLPDAAEFQVDLRVMPLRHPSSTPQVLSVYVNDMYLQDLVLEVGDWQTHSFALPQAFMRAGVTSFRFGYRYAVAPAEIMPPSQETRTLAVAFDYIRIRQLPPAQGAAETIPR